MTDKIQNIVSEKEYMGLLKQFQSLTQLYNSIQSQIAFYREQDYSVSINRLNELNVSLDSEKAMNETLTNENESLRNQLAKCQKDAERWNSLTFCYADNPNVSNYHKATLHVPYLYVEEYTKESFNKAYDKTMSKKG